MRHGASGNVSERLIPDTVSDSAGLVALAAALLRDVADHKAIGEERLAHLAWAVLTRDEVGRLARAVLDGPRDHALRRAVELAAAMLVAGARPALRHEGAKMTPGRSP